MFQWWENFLILIGVLATLPVIAIGLMALYFAELALLFWAREKFIGWRSSYKITKFSIEMMK